VRALEETAKHISGHWISPGVLQDRLVPRATRARRKRLKPNESEKVERLARLMALAESVWENEDDARAFMNEPHPLLEERSPIDVAQTEVGARRIERILMELEYGLPV
jgi:putative toxin-antitoxin system antitoxin component (TIGR02293 family)